MLFSAKLLWCCFLCKNKSSPNAPKLFWNKRGTRSFVGGLEGEGGGHYPPGRARGLGLGLVGSGHPLAHISMRPTPKTPINRETTRNNPRTSTPLSHASVPSKYHLEPCFGPLPEGEIIIEGHLHHPGSHHDEEGVVHPQGFYL